MGQQSSRRRAARVLGLSLIVAIACLASQAHAIVLPILTRPILKTFFEKGDKPTEQQFGNFIDSAIAGNLSSYVEDRDIIGLRQYDPALIYLPGDSAVPLKRFGIGDTTPISPLGYLDPRTTPFVMEPDFAGQFGFLAFQAADTSGTGAPDIYYGYLQIAMDSPSGGATLTDGGLSALVADPPGIHVQYVAYETTPNTPLMMVELPEPTGAAAFLVAATFLRRRRR